MGFEVVAVTPFLKELKRLIRKYPSLKREIAQLADRLEREPALGTALGHGCRKIRIAIAPKSKGKRGGGRMITHVHIVGRRVYLLDIYDKADKADLGPGELLDLLNAIPR